MKIEGRKGGNIDLEEKFLSAITRQPKRRSGIHVTALREECMKMSYLYHVKESPDFKPNKKNLLTFWIGRELHKTPILAQNELILDWNGILGSCDDYENGVLVDKKTCTSIPSQAKDQDARQVEYYALMLKKRGKIVNRVYILYIDINNKDFVFHRVKVRPYDEIEAEMISKRDILQKAKETGVIPPRTLNWKCKYCYHRFECLNEKELENLEYREIDYELNREK